MTIDAAPSFSSLALSAAAILAVPETEPERLFSSAPDGIRAEFIALLKHWHPDINPDPQATDVTARLTRLHKRAQDKIAGGQWAPPGLFNVQGLDGKSFRIRYVKKHGFELGDVYIGKNVIAYAIGKAKADDLVRSGLAAIQGLTYADDKMRKEFAAKVPQLLRHIETKDTHVVVLKKEPAMVLLSDLLDHVKAGTGKPLDPRHVAWIINRLCSFACFLQVNRLTHNGLSTGTILIDPGAHAAAFPGGWWYAAKETTQLKALPGHAVGALPSALLATGRADRRIDLEMIRAVGRELLGDPTGMLLLRDKTVPQPMAQWLTSAAPADAFATFREWSEDILKRSFGARRFTELPVSFGDIYQPN